MFWRKQFRLRAKRNSRKDVCKASGSGADTASSIAVRMDHSHSEDQLWGAVEIIPQRLYYAPLKFFPPNAPEVGDSESDTYDEQQSSAAMQAGAAAAGGGGAAAAAKVVSPPKKKRRKAIHYFSIDNELIYWNFFLDFGPLNLGQLYRFCAKLNAKLSSPEYRDCIICYFSGAKDQARANASFLICAWSMLYLGRTLDETYFGFREEFAPERIPPPSGVRSSNTSLPPQPRNKRSSSNGSSSSRSSGGSRSSSRSTSSAQLSPFARLHPLPSFHDASPIVCTYDLSVYDCLRGLDKARQFGFFKFGNAPPQAWSRVDPDSVDDPYAKPPRDPAAFDVDEYEHFEQVENGDLNWIVHGRILAFAGPQAKKVVTPEGFCMLTPSDYIPHFVKSDVGLVVRLNKKCYDESEFEDVGMRHVEHYYLDGSCPPMSILRAVVADMESVPDDRAVAMHCKAGLGRTGTCIGAYLMKHYRLTAREAIGWMRICRPGMVIGPQQHFLEDIQGLMWQEGEAEGGGGPRSMSIGSDVDAEDEGTEDVVGDGAQALKDFEETPRKGATTPRGGHVSIVTPDGQPLRIPTTPVVARRLDLGGRRAGDEGDDENDDMVVASLRQGAAEASRAIHSAPSSTSSLPTMDALKMDSTLSGDAGDRAVREGDQANALLSRRLDQCRARQGAR